MTSTTGDPTRRMTKNGQTLTAYAWWSLECAYRDAGMDPDAFMVVVQGSFKHGGGASASGSTHDAGDTADLRTRTLPTSVRANMCQQLVVALRARGWCSWYRDQAHGGMDPHIHAVYRWADPSLSSGAAKQVRDYDAGRNGLDNGGPDYHPRPRQTRYPWPGDTPPPQQPPTPDPQQEDTVFTISRKIGQAGDGRFLCSGGRMVGLVKSSWDASPGIRDLPTLEVTDPQQWSRLTAAYGQPT